MASPDSPFYCALRRSSEPLQMPNGQPLKQHLSMWKSADNLTTVHEPRRVSQFSTQSRPPSTAISHQSLHIPEVITTHTIHKDYDPTTGNKMLNQYMILREIGRGVHGKVKLAMDMDTQDLVAIKIVDKRSRRRQLGYSMLRGNNGNNQPVWNDKKSDLPQYRENEQKIRREISILKKCAHPNVVQLKEVIDDPQSRKIYMALEYTEKGEIEWRDDQDRPILRLPEIRKIFRDVVSGLDYLHYQGIIHRDIKPANLLLTSDHVAKISDFGVSYYNEVLAGDAPACSAECLARIDRELAETAGTPAFFAPELCCAGETVGDQAHSSQSEPKQSRPRITKAIDVWALGVTLYCFVFGQCPFIASTEFELFDNIPTEPLVFPDPNVIGFDIPDTLKDLIQRLLEKSPEDRITLEQVKHHPWVIADLRDPSIWWEEADPRRYKQIAPHEDVAQTVTIMDRIRKSLHKLSCSFTNLTHGLGRRPKPTAHPTNHSSHIEPSKPNIQSGEPIIVHTGNMSSTFVVPPMVRPISCLSEDTTFSEDQIERPSLQRLQSTSSSSSGINLTFARHRTGFTPLTPSK
ncbi:kinase-like domain-containing protein [Phycomyces nitens]|nr:kinase-like domain-containing protein [Phycomyces nitens]